jgi:hypothetical protein
MRRESFAQAQLVLIDDMASSLVKWQDMSSSKVEPLLF